MKHQISLDHLREAATRRPSGYFEEVSGAGQIENGILFLEPDVYFKLVKKYSPTKFPSVAGQARNVMSAVASAVKNPTPVSSEELERRLEICNACEFLKDKTRCLKCGCHVNWKARLEAWHCPIEKW